MNLCLGVRLLNFGERMKCMLRKSKEIRLRRLLDAEMKEGLREYEESREVTEDRRQLHIRRPGSGSALVMPFYYAPVGNQG